MTFLGIDAGTTCCKGVLFSSDGKILTTESRDNDLLISAKGTYLNTELIWANVQSILTAISAKYEIGTVAFTSLGESFVALDENDLPIFPPMLYSDPRGSEQATRVSRERDADEIFRLSGVMPDGMYSLYKLLWWKENRPSDYARIRRVFLIGDYLAYRLTGRAVIDRSLAARTGALDVAQMIFSPELLALADLRPENFSEVAPAGTIIGKIRPSLAAALGVSPACTVVAGSHDQVCSALGSGGIREGIGVDGMGTVECIVATFEGQVKDPKMGLQGYPCVPFVQNGVYATYLLNYTCGGAMKWFKSTLMRDQYPADKASFYAFCEEDLDTAHASPLLLLPYLRGAATPYSDIYARGALLGLSCETTAADVYRAILEGTSYEMRLNLETMAGYGRRLSSLVCTGGCANSDAWLQIKANILGLPITRVQNVEAGCAGAAMLGAVALGHFPSLAGAAPVFVTPGKTFLPSPDPSFDEQYEKYKKIYRLTKEIMA